jgi:LysR family transcriptional regulator, nitrogen assimilation regulatory protein
MEVRRLRYFLRIASEGSLGKASRALSVAQPALSRQIQMLEDELGVKLFQRVPTGMKLTDEGAYLKEALEHPIELIDMALHNVKSYSTRVEASLTLGMPPAISHFMGARVIALLQRKMPYLKLRLVEDDSTRLAHSLSRGLVDIALLADATPDSRAFYGEVVQHPLLLVGPRNAPWLEAGTIRLADLKNVPLILPGTQSSLRTRIWKAAVNIDVQIEPAIEIDSLDVILRAVLDGRGYTVLPQIAVAASSRAEALGTARIVAPELIETVYWGVQPTWRVSRSMYNNVERIIYSEWYQMVRSGEWPAAWVMDLSRLSLPLDIDNG